MIKIFVISLINTGSGDHQISAQQILPRSLESYEKFNWNVEIVDAVNGYTMSSTIWAEYNLPQPVKSDKHPEKFGNMPGAHGCFISHFKLWTKCIELNQPIIVLEDDAIALAPLPEINTNLDLVKLHRPTKPLRKQTLGHVAPGAYAYWISPAGAKKLINFSVTSSPGHVDKIIGTKVLDWDYLTPSVIRLGPRIGSSTNPTKYPYQNLYF